ncbi:MAG: HAD family hydrolase [Lachnospiraceae bacterium]
MKKLTQYKLIIWDLDGTLYYQKPFRKKMIEVILKELVFKPSRWKEARVILCYRRLREKWDPSDSEEDLEMRQYAACGAKCGLMKEQIKEIVTFWMHEAPLKYLKAYRDEEAALLIGRLRKKGILNVVYSDYPTKDKLRALEIVVDGQYCSADPDISSMKPNPKGIQVILKKLKIKAEDTLMIGDRIEKDAEAAKAAGVDYLILSRGQKERQQCYSIHCNS